MKRKIFKWVVGILLAPVILFFILAALLYIPPIQNFVVRKATAIVSETTGMDVHIGHLRLSFLFDLDLQDVQVADEAKEELLDIGQLTIDLNFTSLLHGEINVNGIELSRTTVDTKDLIPGLTIKGSIGNFFVDSHGIELPQENVTVNNIRLADADVAIHLGHSESEDTTTSAVNWKIALQQVNLERIRLHLSMPGDSMRIAAGIQSADLHDGHIDLGTSTYTATTFNLAADSILYDLPHEKPAAGLDVNHIALQDVGIGLDSVIFDGNSLGLSLALRQTFMKEKSGLEVSKLTGNFWMDSTSLHIPGLVLHTPNSYVNLKADMDLSAISAPSAGQLSVRLLAELGKQDILTFAGGLPPAFVQSYPNAPVIARVSADGNMDTLALHTVEARLANAFDLKASGELQNLTDSLRMGGQANITLQTHKLDFIKTLAGGGEGMNDIALPPMRLQGKASMKGQQYKADLSLSESKGKALLQATFDAKRMAYQAKMNIQDWQLRHFLPKDSLGLLSLTATAQGQGTDIFKRSTRMKAGLDLQTLEYDSLDLGNLHLSARLDKGQGEVIIDSHNPLLEMTSRANALLSRNNINLGVSLDLNSMDLYALQLTSKPLKTSMNLHIDGRTDLKDSHDIQGSISNIALILQDTTFHPKDLSLNILAHADSTYADISAGDLTLKLDGRDGYEQLMKDGQDFVALMNEQLQRRHLNQDSLKLFLPNVRLNVSSGKENPIANYLATAGYSFNDFKLSIDANPETGLNGGGHVYTLNVGSMTLDTIQMHIFQDSTGVKVDGRVRNGPKNPQIVFDSQINAYLHAVGAGVDLAYTDKEGRKGVDLGLRADVLHDGIKVVFSKIHPILAYRKFDINEDNFIFLGNDRRVEADVSMIADDGTAAKVYSTPNPEALQDISVNLHHFNLEELTSVIPYAPRITGFLETDAHLIQTAEDLSVVADLSVANMTYENVPLGNIALNTVYLPNDDGTHFVDTRVLHNDTEVITLAGAYKDIEGEGHIKAEMNLADFPLSLANGFIPDQMASLEGQANGCLTVDGPTQQPIINGWFSTQDMKIKSSEYSLNLRLDNDTIKVEENKLNLDQLHVYSTGKNPLVFDGTVNFTDFENITLNLSMNALNFELINAKRTQQAAAYGKVYVDVNAMMSGNLNNINIGGRLGLLGTTDVTYVLKDSPLSSEDRLSGLVEFVDFNDTTAIKPEEKAQPMNLNVMMQVNIDQGVQVHCLLSADRSKYIDLEGGGELTMNYTPQGELTMNGRYTVLNGEMKYSLPVIPLKTFTITSGSYVDFNGPILNPTLNISATERVRSTVTENDVPRTVSFDVGLSITRTLSDMGLEFTISAPEDMNVQNQLAAMSAEERGKVAVTMLATGMYLAEGNDGGGFSTSNALNSLLQSEINNIAGKALETIDLSLGVDQETTAEGTSRTDYSFRFAKRFWGNRVSIIIGGKVSTGENVENTGQSLIDNISLEYRLDKSATRYITLFYDKSYESLLEGEITEMGAGLVLRRKMTRLGELFIFKNRRKNIPQPANEKGNEKNQ